MDREDPNANLDEVLVGGRERRPVVVADYDPSWPERFVDERDGIARALGPTARRIDHIGSTAVPGLAAKPIIDMLVVVGDVEDEQSYGPGLENAGYLLRVREPGHRMYRTSDLGVHVHIWTSGDEVRRHLLFRDWLRADSADRRAYESVKRDLAEREWDDMNHYAQAKDAIVAEIMVRAEAWAARVSWAP